MQFLMKLFKALNSAQTPWQVTLALTLGMVVGLTPLSGVQNVVIIFLAFVLNIHLGLFFVASAFFAGIGYLLDPLFEQLGYTLLSAEGLQELWTAWYNSGVMRLTHFNNTLVMGSTVVALLFAVPLYVLLGQIIYRYRDALAVILEKYPRLGLFGILKSEKSRDPIVRWWGAGVFVGFAGLLAFIAMVVLNPLVKWSLEAGGSAALQRDVRIGDVDVGVMDGTITINRLEVASDTKGIDALSIGRGVLDMNLNALLFNRTHIEHIAINGMGFQTEATLQKAAAPAGEKVAGKTSKQASSTMSLPSVEFPSPQSLLDKSGLHSHERYEAARKEVDAIVSKWEKVAKEDLSAKALQELQSDFNALKQQSQSKNPQALLKLKGDIEAFYKKVKNEQKRLKSLQKSFVQDKEYIQSLYGELEQAATEDYNRLKSVYTIGSGGAMNVIGLIFGEQIKGYLDQAMKYYAMVEPYLKSEPEPPVPPRGSGRWMKYPLTAPNPDLWIAKTEIDGVLDTQGFSATIHDVTDNQKKLGRAITFQLASDGPQIQKLSIQGEDNRLGATPLDKIRFESAGMKLDALQMSALTLGQSMMAFKGDITAEGLSTLKGATKLAFKETSLTVAGEDKVSTLVNGALKDIKAFTADVKLDGTWVKPDVGVSTSLDKQIASAVKSQLTAKAETYRKELEGKIDAQMQENLAALKGKAGDIANIDALVGDQSERLQGLQGSAGDLLKKGGRLPIKGLPF